MLFVLTTSVAVGIGSLLPSEAMAQRGRGG